MSDDLTNSHIALLCGIGDHDHSESGSDKKLDLKRLIAEGYVQPTAYDSGTAFELTAKAIALLGERGAGLNEA